MALVQRRDESPDGGCMRRPSAPVAKAAMAYGFNANVARRWRQLACEGKAPPANADEVIVVPLTVARRLRRHPQISARDATCFADDDRHLAKGGTVCQREIN